MVELRGPEGLGLAGAIERRGGDIEGRKMERKRGPVSTRRALGAEGVGVVGSAGVDERWKGGAAARIGGRGAGG